MLTGGEPLPRLHPLRESCFGISDRAADFDVGRAIASHASLGKPGYADSQNPSGFFGLMEDDKSRRRLVRHVTDGELRRHWLFPFRNSPDRAFAGENGGSLATGHIDNYVFNRGEVVDRN